MAYPCLLIGDIGGTNARFAIAEGATPGFSREKILRCADFASATLAIKAYLNEIEVVRPTAICLAVAGPIAVDGANVTNNKWQIDIEELRATFGTDATKLINDFEAIAYAIPALGESDLVSIGSPVGTDLNRPNFTVAVVGPGTGFGAVGLCVRDNLLFPIAGEVGHVGFAPETQEQLRIYSELARRFGRVSNERLLSGPGIENIYQALGRIDGNDSEMSATDIFARAAQKTDICAEATVQIFFEALGQVAGDLALSFGATDGIYIAGGIVQRYPEMLATSGFRRGFENKGRQRVLMEKIPTQLVVHPQPGLLGASYYAGEMD